MTEGVEGNVVLKDMLRQQILRADNRARCASTKLDC